MPVRRWFPLMCIGALALMGSVALYAPTITAGFVWDDYHFIRPYTRAEVLGSFLGSWDATHVEVGFYRPLAVLLAAVRFQAFGYAAVPYHLLSIGLFAVAAALFGAFVLRLSRRLSFALVGVGLFLVHPAMTDSLVAWVTNQFQLLQMIVFLGALHLWLTVRGGGATRWLPLVAFAGGCFLLKEDGIMLLPALLLAELIWRQVYAVPRRVPRGIWVIALATPPALVLVRRLALHTTLAGYGLPPVGVGLHRMLLGPVSMLTGSFGTGAVRTCSMVLIGGVTVLGCLVIARERHPQARFLLLLGAAITVCFGLPVYLAGRDFLLPWHFVALGHVCILLGCVQALAEEAAAMGMPVRLLSPRAALRLLHVPGTLPFPATGTRGDDRYALSRVRAAVPVRALLPGATDAAFPVTPPPRGDARPARPARPARAGATWRQETWRVAPRTVRGTLATLIVCILAVFAVIVHEETRDWSATSVRVQCTDRRVASWGDTVPGALRQALAHKGGTGAAISDETCNALFPS